MVTISNFERYVLPKILARGEDYYDSGAVLGLSLIHISEPTRH